MSINISKESLKEIIEYFSSFDINSPEQLGLFFFFKAIGFNTSEYKLFPKASGLTEEQKNEFNNLLYILSGVFTINEIGGKRTSLFPFSIKQNLKQGNFFNGGSDFKNLLSRLRDTIDNTLVDKYLDSENDKYKFKRKYLEFLKTTYLRNNKISMVYLAGWIARFTAIEINNPSNEEFTRICIKNMEELLNLNREELETIFENDSAYHSLTYSNQMISGDEFRGLFSFDEAPEIIMEGRGLNLNEPIIPVRKAEQYIEVNDVNPSLSEIKDLLKIRKQIILFGVPGVGKSRIISHIQNEYDQIIKIQFHASTSYEGFIGGTTIKDGSLVNEPGVFLKFCNEAIRDTEHTYLFIIDEINRGNVSKIFGETILALDREYEVSLVKPIKIGTDEVKTFKIPENVYIIATMNSADRSIAIVDYAIRRRFGFVKLQPNYEIVNQLSDVSEVKVNIEKLFRSLNNNIFQTLQDENLLLGQSYFLPIWMNREDGKLHWTKKDLRIIFNYSILPIIEEYTYGNKNTLSQILGDKLNNIILDDDDFIEALYEYFPDTKIV